MLFHALRRLAGLMIAFALITAVAQGGGPGLATRSMTGFMAQLDAAESGDYAKADAIGSDLARQWDRFRVQVVLVLDRAEQVLSDLAPR